MEIETQEIIEDKYRPQIQDLISNKESALLYDFPFLYSIQELPLHFSLLLSNGLTIKVYLTKRAENRDSKAVLHFLALKTMKNSGLLYCHYFQACFNPFEEVRGEQGEIPGWAVEQAPGGNGLCIVPVSMAVGRVGELGEARVLLDYFTGNFFLKQSIVKVDKLRGEAHFRDGSIAKRDGLRAASLRPLAGYPLAQRLHNALERIKQASKSLFSIWGIKLDSRFLEAPYSAVQPGTLTFRGNADKSLAELVTPMSLYNYNYSYQNFFKDNSLDDALQCQLVFLTAESYRDFASKLNKSIEVVMEKMKINGPGPFRNRMVVVSSYQKAEELVHILNQESHTMKIYIITHSRKNRLQQEGLERVTQLMIDRGICFHFAQAETGKQINFDVLALHHLAIVYTKVRLNPWKIKNVPFGNTPFVCVSVNIAHTRSRLCSVAVVSTMNVFLTKFTSFHKITQEQALTTTIQELIKQCVDRFKAVHNRSPNRIILFRSGLGSQHPQEQYKKIKENLLIYSSSQLTYITLQKNHPLRTFNQVDSNSISRETVKKIQLLLYVEVRDELYYQLEMEEPMHRIRIYEIERNDPNFVQKILELIAKVVFGGVGNTYGRGLGFISYSQKINSYREFNLEPWKQLLKEGVLLPL